MTMIPKQLQKEDIRFVFLGEWNKWKQVLSCPKCHIVYDLIPQNQ